MARKATGKETAALERAQDLIYDAWEATSAARRLALARKVLSVSPLCADAYVVMARHARPGSVDELEFWRRAVEAGREAIGEADFAEMTGSFWGFLETRPYMRARCGLAMALWARGIPDEAIGHLRDMLRLNPGDNQGLRYILAGYLVDLGRDDDVERLLDDYPDEGSATWAWTKALVAFRRHGDDARSRALLADAVAENGYISAYLLGKKRLPRALPPFVTVGGEDEAIDYAAGSAGGWKNTPGALDWLKGQASARRRVKRAPLRRLN